MCYSSTIHHVTYVIEEGIYNSYPLFVKTIRKTDSYVESTNWVRREVGWKRCVTVNFGLCKHVLICHLEEIFPIIK